MPESFQGEVAYASSSTARVLGYPSRMHTRVREENGHWLRVESTGSNPLENPTVEATRQRAEEEEKQRVIEELTRANAELQAFAYTVAHDLREPLLTISAFTQILVRRAQLEDFEKEIARFIVEGVQRMSTLLDRLLSSATGALKVPLLPVALEAAVEQAAQNLREALTSSRAHLTAGPLPTVPGDECDLVRIFQNLINNAVKYRSEKAVEIRITAERSGPDWVIRVRDNGIGISKEQHQRVFGRFTRLHAGKIPGTGLGLAVCKEIIERLGGTIWVESRPGAGSTFCFTIAAERQENEIVMESKVVGSPGTASELSCDGLGQLPEPTSAAIAGN